MNDQYIMYAPNGELQDSIQASGVIDISNLNRRQIKDLATSAAGWSGKNGGFSANDILSGQADVQGRFTRHEDLFRRKFNKQLNRNLRHTAKMQEIENAKNGDVTALGRYQNYAKEDAAKVFAPLVVGVPMIGTGALSGIAQGGKWLFNNAITGTTLDVLGTIAGHKNYFSDNGYKKTINRAKEGDVWGTIASGAGDVLDVLGPLDLLRRGNQYVKFIQNPTFKYKFKYVDDIGDGSTRWDRINEMDVDQTYDRYVKNGNIDEKQLPAYMRDLKNEIVDDYGSFTINDVGEIDKYYTANREARKQIVDQGRRIEKALNFADKVVSADVDARNAANVIRKGSREDVMDFFEQIKNYSSKETYSKPSFFIDFTKKLGDSENDGRVIIGWNKTGKPKIFGDGLFSTEQVAAHEGGHANRFYHNDEARIFKELFDPNFKNLTDNEKKEAIRKMFKDSPYYGYDYRKLPDRTKKLLSPTKHVNDHDVEFAEGYADLMGTKFNMYDKGISDAALHSDKKYNYFDLLKYKLTPTGIGDRFIRQRGGWWKGWKQQLDALNELKNGGKL